MDGVLTFVDAKTGTVTGKLDMPSEELEAAADGKGSLFIAERDHAKIDGATRTLVTEWPMADCVQPTGVAIDAARDRLLVGCRGEKPVLAVMDTTNGAIVARLPIGRGNDGVIYDPETRMVFASNGVDANLVIYAQTGADSYALAQSLLTRPVARTLTIDPKTKTIFTVTADGMLDPGKPLPHHGGPLSPNTFFDDTLSLLIIGPHQASAPANE